MLKNKKRVFEQVVYFLIATFGVLSLLSLNFFSKGISGGWFYYSSASTVSLAWWQLLGVYLAEVWIYWLGGAAYTFLMGLIIYAGPKVWNENWHFAQDRFFAFLFLTLSSVVMCQIYGVGSFGTFPGGGALGIWLVSKIALSNFVLLSLAKGVMWASLVVYTRVCFVYQVRHLLTGLRFVLRPAVNKIAAKFNWDRLQKLTAMPIFYKPSSLQRTVLEHEYAEVLDEMEPDIHKDIFWQNYTSDDLSALNMQESLDDSIISVQENNSVEQEVFENTGKVSVKKNMPLPKLAKNLKHQSRDQEKFQLTLAEQSEALVNKLKRFGIMGAVTAVRPGPVITLFEFTPAEDAKISKIIALENDLALALETRSIRIIAPVPGRSVVGFEVANKERESVVLSDVLNDDNFTGFIDSVKKGHIDSLKFQLPIAVGKDTIGENIIIDLAKTPHLLVAGSTGSGKSVCLNTILVSLLCANTPDRLRLVLVDPKRLEFARYADIGHLLFPIVTDAKRTLLILRWVIKEMEKRYEQMAAVGVRSMADYNEFAKTQPELSALPYIVIVIDEMADLMMTASKDVEDLIIRIAQMARAAGIHMIIATQRPSVDVITGLIKVNFPSRISFRVASKADSRTVLDCNGAETLLGAGDMLMVNSQSASLRRAHGAYVTDAQVNDVVKFILQNYETNYLNISEMQFEAASKKDFEEDALFDDVLDFLKECDEVSISLLQRKFRIGYNRSARIMDSLESSGYVLTLDGSKMRKVIKDRLE